MHAFRLNFPALTRLPRLLIAAGLIAMQWPAAAQQPAPALDASIAYTVQRGDKLITLTRSLLNQPSDWAEVAKINALRDADVISPGQVLRIPLRLLKTQAAPAKLLVANGDVRVGGQPATVGAALPEGAQLQTGPGSLAVMQLGDGSKVSLLPDSLATVVKAKNYLGRDSGASISTTWFSGVIRLTQGALDTVATKLTQRAHPLQIETATSVVGVRGTEFRVAYAEPGSKNVRTEVLEGKVRADNPAQAVGADLPGGYGAVVRPLEKKIEAKELLKAPQGMGETTAIARQEAGAAQWLLPTTAGAALYRVQVAKDAAFEQVLGEFKTKETALDLRSIDNGDWFVRIRGIDADGLEGYDSMGKLALRSAPPAVVKAEPRWVTQLGIGVTAVVRGKDTVLRFDRSGAQSPAAIDGVIALDPAMAQIVTRRTMASDEWSLGALEPGKRYYLQFQETGGVYKSKIFVMEVPGNWGTTVNDVASALTPLP